jgi:hypothetical protein
VKSAGSLLKLLTEMRTLTIPDLTSSQGHQDFGVINGTQAAMRQLQIGLKYRSDCEPRGTALSPVPRVKEN